MTLYIIHNLVMWSQSALTDRSCMVLQQLHLRTQPYPREKLRGHTLFRGGGYGDTLHFIHVIFESSVSPQLESELAAFVTESH